MTVTRAKLLDAGLIEPHPINGFLIATPLGVAAVEGLEA